MNLGSILQQAKTYIESEVAPVVESGVESTIKFFQLMGVDPKGASAHAVSALATLAALVLVLLVLKKGLAAVDIFLQEIGKFGKWVLSVFTSVRDFAAQEVAAWLKFLIQAAGKVSTYESISLWLCMLDSEVARNISRSFKDGPVHVKYQKNLGYSVLAISLWSTLAFAYAVHIAAGSFKKPPDYLWLFLVGGSLLYGILIFTLDRSIVAPFTPIDPSKLPVSFKEVGFRGWLLDAIERYFGSLVRVSLRIFAAYFIAQFTAIPLTVFILHGGIVEAIKKDGDAQRAQIENSLLKAESDFRGLGERVRQSQPCLAATSALLALDQQINLTASSGCPAGWKSCPGNRTAALQATRPRYEADKSSACVVSSAEIKANSDNIARLNSLKGAIVDGDPDILVGAKYLAKIDQEDSSIYRPVRSTFMLLFVVELIPVLSKIVCELMINRRRRQSMGATVDGPTTGPNERRALYLAASQGTGT